MKRYLIIGIAGVAILLIALILNYWLTSPQVSGPDGVPPVAVAPVPEPAPIPGASPQPATEAELAVEPDSAPSGMPAGTAGPDSGAGMPPPSDVSAPGAPATTEAQPETAPPSDGPKVAVLPPAESQAPASARPSFDVVRVMPTGETVVAGRAPPGAVVTVYDGGRPIGELVRTNIAEPLGPRVERFRPARRRTGVVRFGGGRGGARAGQGYRRAACR